MLRGVLIALGASLLLLLLLLAALYVRGRQLMAEKETDPGNELPPDVPGRLIRVDGHRVHVVERGDGPPLLLVHGTGGTTLDWEASVLDGLAETHRVVALDLYGMGFSERNDRFAYGFPLWADEIAGTLDALGIERASIIGQSLGGAIATFFAARYPARVDRVISVDSGPWLPPFMLLVLLPGSGEFILGRADYWPQRPDQPPSYAARLRQVYRIVGTRRHLLRAIRGQFLQPGEYFRALSRVECPTLLIHGAADDIIPVRAAASLQRVIKDSRMVVLERAGHFSMQDSPRRFLEEARRFLDQEQHTNGSARPAVEAAHRGAGSKE